ncbi:hypothetical protein HanPSC8_Chr11g0475881 [Helianthus annuus]|nr:hypothetical protein HanPSC8_Chr11g0475881 [Helianthus annuus]
MDLDEWLFTLRFIIFLVQFSSPLSSDQKSFWIIIIFIIRYSSSSKILLNNQLRKSF